ncbi:hypothetical protein PG997_014062 [Apiospora hydei]|uniref:Uncharacterized protein n=1 Tax=Apiospora hydei TaxID=1337664 RepID=A0ABR1V7Z3_9PEZI
MKTTTSSLRLLPYLGLTLLLEEVTAQDVSTSSLAATDVETSVVYTTVTSYIVDPGAAQPSSSTSSLYSAADVSASLTATVTVDSYLPTTTSTSTFLTSYYDETTSTSSTSSTIYYTPPTSSPSSSWESSQYTQYTSHDHGGGGPPSSTTTTTVFALPPSTDASAYLHHVFPTSAAQPTWATGSFYTQLASALYAVDRSFAGRADYATIVAAISRAGDADSPSSAWGWAAVTTNGWYQSDVPQPVQSDVSQYVGAWRDAEFSVLGDAQKAEATATGKGGMAAAARMG